MDFIIRKATVNDVPAVLELIQQLADFEKEPGAVEVTLKELEQAGFGDSPQFTCFVAEVNNSIHGMALVYFRFSTWKGKTVHLEDLIVHKDWRRKGLGVALYKRVLEYAKNEGVRRVEWVVLDWNTPAINFYKKSGANVLKDWYTVQMSEQQISYYLSSN
ncbi:GNAT family N-acetyltransferase [Gangjinia marincola]|uniref:GNAT family N-acetyltransferase n=1 Tax=Gangjinia marincola TaxID=578463 RepID=A0ABP3XWW4_9FLAO